MRNNEVGVAYECVCVFVINTYYINSYFLVKIARQGPKSPTVVFATVMCFFLITRWGGKG